MNFLELIPGISYTDRVDDLQDAAKDSVRNIQKRVMRYHVDSKTYRDEIADKEELASERGPRISDGECAWGQYLTDSHQNHGVGTYGTSAAVRILGLNGYSSEVTDVDADREEIESMGQQWLRSQWKEGSPTWKDQKQAVVYRCIAFQRSLARPTCSRFSVECPCHHLWNKGTVVDDRMQWYEYAYDDGSTDTEPRDLSTAYALYGLQGCSHLVEDEDERGTYHEALCDLADELLDAEEDDVYTKRRIVELSICLLALTDHRGRLSAGEDVPDSHRGYGFPHPAEKKTETDERISGIAKQIGHIMRTEGPLVDTYYIRLFSTPKPRLRDCYYPFAVGPVAALALLRAGKRVGPAVHGRNLPYLNEVVETYAEEFGLSEQGKGHFSSDERGAASIGDHAWVAEALDAYADIDPDEIPDRSIARGKASTYNLIGVVLVALVVALVVAIGWLSYSFGGTSSFVQTMLLVLLLTLLSAFTGPQLLGDRIRRNL